MTTYYKIHVMCDKNCQKCTYTSGWQKKKRIIQIGNNDKWYRMVHYE